MLAEGFGGRELRVGFEVREGLLAAGAVARGEVDEEGSAVVERGGGVLEGEVADCVCMVLVRRAREGVGRGVLANGEADAFVGACYGGDACVCHCVM